MPALLMGWWGASPLYAFLWAMAWAPLLSWLPEKSGISTAGSIARQIGSLIVTSILACIFLGSLYALAASAADLFNRYPNVTATVEGNCDERGTREYNLALGNRRANAAKDFLVNAGVSSSRLSVISYGKEKPVATGSDEASWAQNRRAVAVVPQ